MKNLYFLLFVLLCMQSSWAKDEKSKLPNVVVVVADDIGTGDISYYRKMFTKKLVVETPNIDQLAEKGMIFTDAHSPAALCAPSRYAIMTGNSTYRSDFPWGVWSCYEKSPIKENQLTLGKLMQQAGYKTGFFGKWHLGGDFRRKSDKSQVFRMANRSKISTDVDITEMVGSDPHHNGFDYSYTFPSGIQSVPYAIYENNKWVPLKKDSKIDIITKANMAKVDVKLQKSDGLGDSNWHPSLLGPLLAKKGVEYINKSSNQEKPFFMYYCSQAVHLPHNPPEELNGKKVKGATPVAHLDMVVELDLQMGMLIDALKKNGVFENTLFIFTSDNGGLTRKATIQTGHSTSNIYRGGKNRVYEGGHRVPFIAYWGKGIKSGQVSDKPVVALDIMATLAAVTQQGIAEDQALDSFNLLPILLSKKNAKERDFMMLQGGTAKRATLIEDGWKLIVQYDKKDKFDKKRKPIALFDLNENVVEDDSKNLINQPEYKDRVERMFKKFNQLRDQKSRTTKLAYTL